MYDQPSLAKTRGQVCFVQCKVWEGLHANGKLLGHDLTQEWCRNANNNRRNGDKFVTSKSITAKKNFNRCKGGHCN